MSENELTTRFMEAAVNGDIEVLQLCLEQGADINVRGKARRKGYTEIEQILLQAGAK